MDTIQSDEIAIKENRSIHEKKKLAIIQEFRTNLTKIAADKSTFALDKKTSNLFRNRKTAQSKKLNVKHFNQIISIDPETLIAEIEGMVTYEALVNETLKYNCLPPVVPELKTITVGGALVGLGIESSSFRYGLVHETIVEIEVLTGDGNVLTCTAENEHRDLFYAFPNSYGTLGYALKIKMKLIPAKKFIRLTNLRFNNPNSFFEKLQELCIKNRSLQTDSYIDGVIFDKTEMYIIVSEPVDKAPFVNNYTYLNIYYQSIQKNEINYLSTYDYIWRWDADWFWCSKHFGMNYKILRFLFGKFMLGSARYWKIKHLMASNSILKWATKILEKPSESVIQDILIPFHNVQNFFTFFQSSIGIAPIWICPFMSYKQDQKYTFCNLDPSTLYIDFGFWDIVPSSKGKGFLNKMIERKTEELGGFKSLYSDSYYTEEEFWKIYSKNTFETLKTKYDSHKSFKGLFEKCVHKK